MELRLHEKENAGALHMPLPPPEDRKPKVMKRRMVKVAIVGVYTNMKNLEYFVSLFLFVYQYTLQCNVDII